MKKATISQLKNELSEILDAVRNGEHVLVLDRNTPIARIVSARATEFGSEADDARLMKLERMGAARRGDPRALNALVKRRAPVATARTIDAVGAVLGDREDRV